MLKESTGLRNYMALTGSLKQALNLGTIVIYAGVVPATADAALNGNTVLCTVTNNSTGTGITFDTSASGGTISKAPAEVWSGLNATSGVASFYRHVAPGDDGTSSALQSRLQGQIATSGAELNLTSVSLVAGATQTVDFYSISVPTL